MVAPLLEQIDQPIDALAADGAYDKRKVYDALNKYAPNANALIPYLLPTSRKGSIGNI